MNPKLDPTIARKLNDFRERRRNLILLRGFCSGVLSFLGTFVIIALIDYVSQARMNNEMRSGLSIAGYIFVAGVVWYTCLRLLLQLPSSKKLARLLEQSSPDLQEDLISAVELGQSNQGTQDSETFRKLVQQQASSKASKIDIKTILPIGRLKHWLSGTVAIILLTLALLQIPEFGGDLKLLLQRAIVPGANLPPVTNFEVRILAPDENVTRTPSNEPLRFVALVKAKKENAKFEEISLETKAVKQKEQVYLTKRETGKFFVDYNVGNEKFLYRVLIDQAPQTEWRKMEVGSRPFVREYQKNFQYPAYSELEPEKAIEKHGDLEAWEGTEIDLSMYLSQPVKSGMLEFQWVEQPQEKRMLNPSEDGTLLVTKILMKNPGTYRVRNLIDQKWGWEGRPSSLFEISVKPDLAPSILWVEPDQRAMMVAPNDLLSFTALAKDDLGLARIEYLIKKNRQKWEAFPIPNLLDPRRQQTAALSFNLDLLKHKLKAGSQAFLKLKAYDLKGSIAETEVIQLTIISRDFDLSGIHLLQKKAKVIEDLETIKKEVNQIQKNFQQTMREFQQSKITKDVLLEKANQAEIEFSVTGNQTYKNSLKALLSMPRGSDSYELSILAQAEGQIFRTLGTVWQNVYESIAAELEINRVRSKSNNLTRHILNKRAVLAANFRNVSQDLLNQHAEIIGVSYLKSLHKRQKELITDSKEKKPFPFLSRRQEVALNQWDPIEKALSFSRDWQRSSTLKKIKSDQVKFLQVLNEMEEDKSKLRKQMIDWEKTIEGILRQVHQKLASKTRESFRQKPEELFWNLNRNYLLWDELSKKWQSALQAKPDMSEIALNELLGEINTLVAETMMCSEVEQTRKDQNSLFVKDAGQVGRALIKLQQEIRQFRDQTQDSLASLSDKSEKLKRAFQILLLQHHLIGSANQVIYFMRQENGNSSKWQGAECARQWGRVEAIWKPCLDMMNHQRVSKEVIELMKKLSHQQHRKDLIREMQSRTKSISHNPKSMFESSNRVFQDLQRIISLLKDEVKKARAFVNQIAPSLPELARELARETEEQQQKVEKTLQEDSASLDQQREELTELTQQQEEIGNSVENFAQALRQEANIQNLLDQEGREIARDSDDAAALVEEREQKIEENLLRATQADRPEDLDNATEETIEEQEKLVDELNLIAEHFEKLNEQQPVTETRDQLRQLEEQLEIAEEIDEQYEQAERLADLAQLAPEELLAELEEELKENQAMQRELSDLAQETVEKAEEQLEKALDEEENLLEKLEKENKQLQKQKKDIAKELEKLAKESEQLASQKIDPIIEQAKNAESESVAKDIEEISEELTESAEETREDINEDPTTQDLRDTASALADSLQKTGDDLEEIAGDLKEQSELSPEAAKQEADNADNLARENQKLAEELQKKAADDQLQAQQAQQESLRKKIEENQAKDELADAKAALEQAEDLADNSPNDPTLQEDASNAENNLAEKTDDLLNAQEKASNAEKKAEDLQDDAKLSQAEAEAAIEVAENAIKAAEEAEKLANALSDENSQPVLEATEKGMELAQEASEKARALQEKAEELADALEQLTEQAEGNSEILADAEKVQEQLAEDIFDTSQDLAQAARHEERLGNDEVSEALEDLADSTENTALSEIPETEQALENQALANELAELAESAKDLASDLAQSSPQGDETAAALLNELGESTDELLEENPSFNDLQQQVEEFSELANATESDLSELADEILIEAKEAQKTAEVSMESAEQAKAEFQEAQTQADQATEEAKGLAQNTEDSSQPSAESTGAQEQTDPAAEAAQNAEQLTAEAEKKGTAFEDAQEQALADQSLANEASSEANKAAQQAKEAAELADAADELLEQFPESSTTESLADLELPSAAMALNDVGNSLEQQIEALENLQSGESEGTPPSISEPKEQTTGGIEPFPSTENLSADGNSFDNSTPFSDPEVSEVLAQTLDDLDEALFASENPFSDAAEPIAGEMPGNGEPSQAPSSEKSPSNESSDLESFASEPSEPMPGSGPGSGGTGPLAGVSSANDAIAQALQSLQMATEAHAQAMSQQRSKIMMADAKGNQFNSNDGTYEASPVADVGELPIFEVLEEEEDWGKLPPKLAKDLMEAKRERVSENYRNQVQAYFQAMSAKARTSKK